MGAWLLRAILPPELATNEKTSKAKTFHSVASTITLTLICVLSLLVLLQPDTLVRRASTVGFLLLLWFLLLQVNRRGYTTLASGLFIAGLMSVLTYRTLTSGGLSAPAMQLYLVVVLMAGVLLETRGGVIAAVAAGSAGLSFAWLERNGLLPAAQLTFTPMVSWFYSVLTIGMSVVLMRQVSGRLRESLDHSNEEIRARKVAEDRLRLALYAGDASVWSQDPKTRRFTADEKLFAWYGVKPAPDGTVSIEAWLASVLPEDRSQVLATLSELEQGAQVAKTEFRIEPKGAARRYIEAAGTATRDEDGNVVQIVGVNIDISARRTNEEERLSLTKELGERVKELGLLHSAAKLMLEDLSDAELMRQLVGRLPPAWQFPECCEARITFRGEVMATPGFRDSPWKQVEAFHTSRGDGTIEVVYLEPRPEADEGPFVVEERALLRSLVEMLVTQLDLRAHQRHLEDLVTTRTEELVVAREQAEQASRAKSRFLATMSHEIRTPMNAILGYAQLLQRDPTLGTEQRHKIGVIHSSGNHLLSLLSDVLHMSRIEAGRIEIVTAPLDLYALLDEMCSMFAAVARDKRVGLSVQRADDLPRYITADAGKVRQVVINLLSNAMKFTEHGAVSIHASSQPASDGSLAITVSVRDSGAGISADDLSRIFGTFEQTSHGARAGGAGLGLAIGRQLARLMHGDLTARSELNVGSTFSFSFRARKASASDVQSGHARRIAGLAPGERRPKILIVDDEPDNRDVLRELLDQIGYQTKVACSAEEAMGLHDEWGPELVLMDLMMPGMGGVEAIRRLRAQGAKTRLVALTASSADDGGTGAIAAGADAFWWKPYDESDLLAKLGELLGVRYASQETLDLVHVRVPTPDPRETLAGHLTAVPFALRERLRDVSLRARATAARSVADDLGAHSKEAAEIVHELLDGYRYDTIVSALELASELPNPAGAG